MVGKPLPPPWLARSVSGIVLKEVMNIITRYYSMLIL